MSRFTYHAVKDGDMVRLTHGLPINTTIVLKGRTLPPYKTNRFSFNLICGKEDKSDIAFHFNPRFGKPQEVVRNTMRDGKWGKSDDYGGFPFQLDESFTVEINVLLYKYEVYVNGNHFCDYAHRIAVNQVTHFKVSEEVYFDDIEIWDKDALQVNRQAI